MNIELLGQEPQDDDAICAARYRWLRENAPGIICAEVLDFPSFQASASDLDSAIDQAMKETP